MAWRRMIVKRNIYLIYVSMFLISFGLLFQILFYIVGMSPISSWFLGVIWVVVITLYFMLFFHCMLYRIDIEEEGIRLYFTRVCDRVIDTNYRDIEGKKVKDKHIEINREEGWILIRWKDIEEIRVGRKLSEPKCNVILKGGHRVKFFNFVDKEVVDAISKAYMEYKRYQKRGYE